MGDCDVCSCSGITLIDLADVSPLKLISETYLIYLDGIVPNVSFLVIIGGVLNVILWSAISSYIDFFDTSGSMKCFKLLDDYWLTLLNLLVNWEDLYKFDSTLLFIWLLILLEWTDLCRLGWYRSSVISNFELMDLAPRVFLSAEDEKLLPRPELLNSYLIL